MDELIKNIPDDVPLWVLADDVVLQD